MIELIRALGFFCEPPSEEHVRIAKILGFSQIPTRDLYEGIFCRELPPYASEYIDCGANSDGEALERISGFWRALQRDVPNEPDHLSGLLGLVAYLEELQGSEKEPARAVLIRRSRSALLWEHLLPWLPMYLDKVESIGGDTVYGDWARLLSETLVNEYRSLGPLENLPIHLASSSGLPDPRDRGAKPFVSSLFCPNKSGFVLLSDDLSELATELGVTPSYKDPRLTLEDLLRLAPKETLNALANLASEMPSRLISKWGSLGEITAHWEARNEESTLLLEQLVQDLEVTIDLPS